MDIIAVFVKKTVPKYLQKLPIPESLDDVEKLSGSDWLQLTVLFLGLVIVVMSVLRTILPRVSSKVRINNSVQLDQPKVATLKDIEDLGDGKSVFCRCWKSKKFPMCDGSHNQHNQDTGDNVGPLIIERKEEDKEK